MILSKAESIARTLHDAGLPRRVLILAILADGRQKPSGLAQELATALGESVSLSAIRTQVTILVKAGLIDRERHGHSHLYVLTDIGRDLIRIFCPDISEAA